MLHRRTFIAATAGAALAAGSRGASAQQAKWDMPTPYADGNFHTQNVRQFAEEAGRASNNRLAIQVHSNASLLRLPEIKRGVQTGQVQIGETLISTLGNEDAMFAFDSVPGLATSYDARASSTTPPARIWSAASTGRG